MAKDMRANPVLFCAWLKSFLIQHKLSQMDVERHTGIKAGQISQYVNNKTKPSYATQKRIKYRLIQYLFSHGFRKAKDFPCNRCSNQAEVFMGMADPDAEEYPMCKKCAKEWKEELIVLWSESFPKSA